MLASDFDYDLPDELIADVPPRERDAARLMITTPAPAAPIDATFRDIGTYLRPGDLLVLNDSRVLPARLYGHREPGGGACELLLLHALPSGPSGEPRWSALVRPGRKLRPGSALAFAHGLTATVEDDLGGGERAIRFHCEGDFRETLEAIGQMPLPPYILARRGEKESRASDRADYQTVYARVDGSVAAPTAGLHFTKELLASLAEAGIPHSFVTLHVGLGTFQPIATDRVEDHRMHSEEWEVPPATAEAIAATRARGGRVIAVGTTAVRTLESAARPDGTVRAGSGSTDIFIAPGYRFRVVDGLVTNFHLPRSTLLCLVAALTGHQRLLELYRFAVAGQYRFYSYGDAMLIPPTDNRPESTE